MSIGKDWVCCLTEPLSKSRRKGGRKNTHREMLLTKTDKSPLWIIHVLLWAIRNRVWTNYIMLIDDAQHCKCIDIYINECVCVWDEILLLVTIDKDRSPMFLETIQLFASKIVNEFNLVWFVQPIRRNHERFITNRASLKFR